VRSDEFKQRISKLHKGKTKSTDHREKIALSLKNYVFTDEHKKKLSDAAFLFWKKRKEKQTKGEK
jgi:hypothetical protein